MADGDRAGNTRAAHGGSVTFGKPLRYSLKGVRAPRVADYRMLYIIIKKTVYIGAIKHRSVVYDSSIEKRFA